jgi:hypothetical protein
VEHLLTEMRQSEAAGPGILNASSLEDGVNNMTAFLRPAGYTPGNPQGVPSYNDRLADARNFYGGAGTAAQSDPLAGAVAMAQPPAAQPQQASMMGAIGDWLFDYDRSDVSQRGLLDQALSSSGIWDDPAAQPAASQVPGFVQAPTRGPMFEQTGRGDPAAAIATAVAPAWEQVGRGQAPAQTPGFETMGRGPQAPALGEAFMPMPQPKPDIGRALELAPIPKKKPAKADGQVKTPARQYTKEGTERYDRR